MVTVGVLKLVMVPVFVIELPFTSISLSMLAVPGVVTRRLPVAVSDVQAIVKVPPSTNTSLETVDGACVICVSSLRR